jgi:hypothetical protein
MSIRSAAGSLGNPGIVIMSPQSITTNPASAASQDFPDVCNLSLIETQRVSMMDVVIDHRGQ